MAWFDYVQALGGGLQQGVQNLQVAQKLQREQQDRARKQAMENFSLLNVGQDYTPEEVEAITRELGAGLFEKSKTDPTKVTMRRSPQEESQLLQLADTKEQISARQTYQKLLDTGKFGELPADKALALLSRARVPVESAPFSPTQMPDVKKRNFAVQVALDKQLAELQNKLLLAEIRAASAENSANARVEAAQQAAQIRLQIEEMKAEIVRTRLEAGSANQQTAAMISAAGALGRLDETSPYAQAAASTLNRVLQSGGKGSAPQNQEPARTYGNYTFRAK